MVLSDNLEAPASVEAHCPGVALPDPEPERAKTLLPRQSDASTDESAAEPPRLARGEQVEPIQFDGPGAAHAAGGFFFDKAGVACSHFTVVGD